jgi:hypothetical protein
LLGELLRTSGYENGVTTIIGTAEPGANCLFLPRLPINSDDEPRLFEAKLKGDYDWLYAIQYVKKLVKVTNHYAEKSFDR